MLGGLIQGASGLFGGGSKAAAPSNASGSQDGNQLRSGTGSFTVGGPPPWVWWLAAVFGLLAFYSWFTKKG